MSQVRLGILLLLNKHLVSLLTRNTVWEVVTCLAGYLPPMDWTYLPVSQAPGVVPSQWGARGTWWKVNLLFVWSTVLWPTYNEDEHLYGCMVFIVTRKQAHILCDQTPGEKTPWSIDNFLCFTTFAFYNVDEHVPSDLRVLFDKYLMQGNSNIWNLQTWSVLNDNFRHRMLNNSANLRTVLMSEVTLLGGGIKVCEERLPIAPDDIAVVTMTQLLNSGACYDEVFGSCNVFTGPKWGSRWCRVIFYYLLLWNIYSAIQQLFNAGSNSLHGSISIYSCVISSNINA